VSQPPEKQPATGQDKAKAAPKPGARRARVPTILQMEAVECGAACLAMVLAHHGLWVPLEELRVACGVSRDGSKASNLLRAARTFGFTAKGFRKEPAQLVDLPVPSIIHWNFNHYVVLEGIRDGWAYINDPSSGPRRLPLDELDEAFTGVVLAFSPNENFRSGGQRPRIWHQIKGHLAHSWGPLAVIAGFSMLLVLPGIVLPGLSKTFIDAVLVNQRQDWVVPLCLGVALAGTMQGLLTYFQQRQLTLLRTKLALTLATRYLFNLLARPMHFFNQRMAGDLANRAAAVDQVAELLSGSLATNIFNLTAVLFYGLAMAAYDPLLALIAVALVLGNITVLKLAERRRVDLSRNRAAEEGKLMGATAMLIGGIESIKVGGLEGDVFGKWSGYQARLLATGQALGRLDVTLGVIPTLLTALSTAALLGIGGWRVIDGSLTVGSLVAIQALMVSFTTPINGLVTLAGQLQTIRGDLDRIADVVNDRSRAAEAGPPARPIAALPERLAGRLELRDISFGYSPCDPPLVEDLSLLVEPGRRVALVGASGSGKSTVGRMVCRLLRPWGGEILIDGVALDDLPPDLFAQTVAYVDQDVFLFGGTVRDNLTLWDATVPEAALTQALKDAEIHAEISLRPGHYDSAVLEGGLNFSGGQRQRLEIARALLRDPAILVLDEATAALDPVTEKAIDDNIRRRGCTCLIIAHRLSTIRDCDEIIVLERGRVVQRGNHAALVAEGGPYAALLNAEGA
jgi:NHLM bacteriocin system ABC transporter peptidase/ATP-binding protein